MAKSREKKIQDRRLSMMQDYKNLFGTVTGKRVLNDMMATHHIMSSTFGQDANVNVALIREGERNVILRILSLLKLDINQVRERIEYDENIRDNETIV